MNRFDPRPGGEVSDRRPRLAAGFESPSPGDEARLWLDGREIDVETERTDTTTTVSARPDTPLDTGDHSVVGSWLQVTM